ncbi:hypothetical protein GCM10011351_01560 [Paraliobacillus quinghaiensis]|uniref:Uncharacterized protein n=1 Tax=Paraliobacillus quinghaiensis TaxID=470815 RepID=A0A917TG18_9BACI|nr:hypothetical protein [Paraliobacillus quinghaiensis]GGM19389.1 hypothetical protein GCM10011351_01560 [Paraliobacillus quinghaiensis]
MPAAFMLGPIVMKSSLIFTVISFIIGFFVFWFNGPYTKEKTKRYLDHVSNYLIIFVVALWISKIALHFSIFLKDPIAVLAFPSNSTAFYIAIILLSGYGWYQIKKALFEVKPFLLTLIFVLIVASFSFIFSQLVFFTSPFSVLQLGLYFVLVLLMLLVQGKVNDGLLIGISLVIWGVGHGLLGLFNQQVIFQFSVDSWFFIMIGLIGVLLLVRSKKV